jgi:hypothetical protein
MGGGVRNFSSLSPDFSEIIHMPFLKIYLSTTSVPFYLSLASSFLN